MNYKTFIIFFSILLSSTHFSHLQASDYDPSHPLVSSEEQIDDKWTFVYETLGLDPERYERHKKAAAPILSGTISAFKAFQKGQEAAIAGWIKLDNEDRQIRRIKEGVEIVNEETKLMAKLLTSLLQDVNSVQFIKDKNVYYMSSKGAIYDLKKLLEFVNFNKILVVPSALNKYHNYIDSDIIEAKPWLPSANGRPTDKDFKKADPKNLAKDLVLAEKEAINIYTGTEYRDMNAFLRGDIDSIVSGMNAYEMNSRLREVILHCAVAVSGLNKMPDYKPPVNPDGTVAKYLYRGEGSTPAAVMEKRKWSVQQGGEITSENGFISTAYGKPAEAFFGEHSSCGIMFRNLKAKEVTPLSMFGKQEREVIIPPTHIQWRYHKDVVSDNNKKKIPVFLAKPVTAPFGTIPRAGPLAGEAPTHAIVE